LGRSIFATSAVFFVTNLGLDRLDIDWEYLKNDIEAENIVLLLQAIRGTFDIYSNLLSLSYHFQLTVACSTRPNYYQTLHLADIDQFVDFWNLIAYNYARY
jgi:chitinase